MDNILNSVKIKCGLTSEETHFDEELKMDINSVFMILTQLGVGPKEGFALQTGEETWDQFVTANEPYQRLEAVKTYMAMKVKLMFDNSTMSSSLIDVYERHIKEFEWRLNVAVDPGKEDANV